MADRPENLETVGPKSKKGRVSGPRMAPNGQDEIDPDFEANTSTSEDEDETMNEEEEEGQEAVLSQRGASHKHYQYCLSHLAPPRSGQGRLTRCRKHPTCIVSSLTCLETGKWRCNECYKKGSELLIGGGSSTSARARHLNRFHEGVPGRTGSHSPGYHPDQAQTVTSILWDPRGSTLTSFNAPSRDHGGARGPSLQPQHSERRCARGVPGQLT